MINPIEAGASVSRRAADGGYTVCHVSDTGSVAFTALALDSPAQWLMLADILVNAGV